MRRRAIGLAAAAAAGALAGLFTGWLAFGRAASEVATRADVEGLAESVERLRTAVERLAEAKRQAAAREAQSRPPGATAPGRRDAKPPPPPIEPGVKFHSTFEKGTDGWFVMRFMPEIMGKVSHTNEEGHAKEGTGALALRYTTEPEKFALVMRPTTNINRLSFWVRTLERPAELVVAEGERDESNYQTMLHLEPAEGWKRFEYDLGAFGLSADSADENDRLDFGETGSVAFLEVSGFMGATGTNTLLFDEVVGEYREGGAPAEGEGGQQF
jgi:hypothetical protein